MSLAAHRGVAFLVLAVLGLGAAEAALVIDAAGLSVGTAPVGVATPVLVTAAIIVVDDRFQPREWPPARSKPTASVRPDH